MVVAKKKIALATKKSFISSCKNANYFRDGEKIIYKFSQRDFLIDKAQNAVLVLSVAEIIATLLRVFVTQDIGKYRSGKCKLFFHYSL